MHLGTEMVNKDTLSYLLNGETLRSFNDFLALEFGELTMAADGNLKE